MESLHIAMHQLSAIKYQMSSKRRLEKLQSCRNSSILPRIFDDVDALFSSAQVADETCHFRLRAAQGKIIIPSSFV